MTMKKKNIKKLFLDSINSGLKLANERLHIMSEAELEAFDVLMSFKEEVEYFLGKENIVKIKRNQKGDEVSALIQDSDLSFTIKFNFDDMSTDYDAIIFETHNFSTPSNIIKSHNYNSRMSDVEVIKNAICNICKDPTLMRKLLTYGEPDFLTEKNKTTYLKNKNMFYLTLVDTFKNLERIEKIHSIWKNELTQLSIYFKEDFAFDNRQTRLVFENKNAMFLSLPNQTYNIEKIIDDNQSLFKMEEKQISPKIKNIIRKALIKSPSFIAENTCEDKFEEFKPKDTTSYSFMVYKILNNYIKIEQKTCLSYVSKISSALNEIYNTNSEIVNNFETKTMSLNLNNIELFKIKFGIDEGVIYYTLFNSDLTENRCFSFSEESFFIASKPLLSSCEFSRKIEKIIKQ